MNETANRDEHKTSTIVSVDVDARFNIIIEKLQQLTKKQNRLQKENEQLRQKLDDSQKKQAEYEQKIVELEQKTAILKMSAGEMLQKDKKQFEKILNHYIREIDKCIAYLSE